MFDGEPEDRLIVAADFNPDKETNKALLVEFIKEHGAVEWVKTRTMILADKLSGTGVYIKVNSALRAYGYGLIHEIHNMGLKVFDDLKLVDITETLATDGALLRDAKPELLTVMCSAGVRSMQTLRDALPDTEILGVTVLTHLTNAEVYAIHRRGIRKTVLQLARLAEIAEIGGLVSAPKQAGILRREFGNFFSLNAVGVRPSYLPVEGDDQNQKLVTTPRDALRAGVDRVIIGRPITQAANPREAMNLVLDEIAAAL